MALLNRGLAITPVGSSDSHDVGRHFVGQGRTYIRVADRDPGQINVDQAVESFQRGNVLVSYGLLAEMTVNEKYQSGDLAASGDEVKANIRVLGPHWVQASTIQLYANGRLIREETIRPPAKTHQPPGVKWQAAWTIPRPKQDLHLVAVALGPGIAGPYWRTARPYQPTSPEWQPYTLACSGAVRVDADGDGRWTSARGYAEPLVAAAFGDATKLLASLATYDEATAAQAAHLYRLAGKSLLADEFSLPLKTAGPATTRHSRLHRGLERE